MSRRLALLTLVVALCAVLVPMASASADPGDVTRVEYEGISYQSTYGPFSYFNNPGDTYGTRIDDPSCSDGYCMSAGAATYTFTLTTPSSVAVYGAVWSGGCNCRTWQLDGGATQLFSDVTNTPSFQRHFFTTGILPVGPHTLRIGAVANDAIVVDYLELTQEPPGTELVPPVVTVPSTQVVRTSSTTGAAVTFSTSAADVYGVALPVTCDQTSGSTFALGVTQVTCEATDARGNPTTRTFAVNVTRTMRVEYEGVSYQSTYGPFDYYVNAGQTYGYRLDDPGCSDGYCMSAGAATYTFTLAEPSTVAAYGGVFAGGCNCRTWQVDSGTTHSFSDATIHPTYDMHFFTTDILPVGTHTLRVGAVANGNIVLDYLDIAPSPVGTELVPPVVDVPPTQVARTTSTTGDVVTYSVTATDVYGLTLPVTCDPASGTVFPLGTTQVTCQATDARGNTTTRTFAVDVTRTMRVEYEGAAGQTTTYGSFSYYNNPGDTYGTRIDDPSCSAGYCMSTGAATYTFTLAQPSTLAVYGAVWAGGCTCRTWQVDGGTTHTFSDATIHPTFQMQMFTTEILPVGTHTLRIGAVANGTIVLDYVDVAPEPAGTALVPPVVTVPSPQTVRTASSSGAPVPFTTSAADVYGLSLPVTCTPASGTTFPLGVTHVSCSATDARGNTGTSTFDVTVTQVVRVEYLTGAPFSYTTPSTLPDAGCSAGSCISAGSATYTFTLTQPSKVVVRGAVFAGGCNCRTWVLDGGTPTTFSDATNQPTYDKTFFTTPILPVGAHTLQVNAVANGNLVLDYLDVSPNPAGTELVAPVVTVPANQSVSTTSTSGTTVTFAASAKDVYGVTVATTCTPASGSTFPIGTTQVSCQATDARGNTATKAFNVTVTLTVRVEYALGSPFAYTFGSKITDPGCSAGYCISAGTANYTFTLTQPAKISVYGSVWAGGCTCRTWQVDTGSVTTFSDSTIHPTYNKKFFTTGVLAAGTHTLKVGAVANGNIVMDYLDIIPS